MMDRKEIFDKVAGCLIGGALGDALGYEVEFLPWETIQKRYGRMDHLVLYDGAARFSDDTQMTLFTNEGLILCFQERQEKKDGTEVIRSVYEAYLCWLKTQGEEAHSLLEGKSELLHVKELNERRAPGNTCLSALRSGRMGTLDEPVNYSKGCGGVMRSAPMGFIPFAGDPLMLGAGSAAITHGHPGAWAPAGMLADIVARCIFGEKKPLKTIITESLQAAEQAWSGEEVSRFTEMIRDAIWLSGDELPEVEAIHSIGGGWVGDQALAIAVYSCLKHPDDLREALITAVNHSGDSDSTGAIAGNILGAMHGLAGAPKDWVRQVECTDVILLQAEKITDLICGER